MGDHSDPKLQEYVDLLEEMDRRDKRNMIAHVFPDHTHEWRGRIYYSRDRYQDQVDFLAGTAKYREMAMMAANQVGKTTCGGFGVSTWLTGLYPSWWEGKRFPGPTRGWAAGKTNESVRDIIQVKLCGDVIQEDGRKSVTGTGLIPGDLIGAITWRNGIADTIDTIQVRHVSGAWSVLGLKSYQQGRDSFEGTVKDFIWFDEEASMNVMMEALTRTATTGGVMINTFTPLLGLSEGALRFVPGGVRDAG